MVAVRPAATREQLIRKGFGLAIHLTGKWQLLQLCLMIFDLIFIIIYGCYSIQRGNCY
jgi:hypothetical protein